MDTLDEIALLLRSANRVLFITGAGLSADSGLPTYRGIGGLYNDELTDDEIPIEQALSGDMLRQQPELTWKYLLQIETSCRGARYNSAHQAIAQLEQQLPHVCVLAQNIDDFHRDAGSQNLIEIHGNIHGLICTHCQDQQWVADYSQLNIPPSCQHCQAAVRPEVVLFGEMLPEKALEHLYTELQSGFDLVFSVGTTAVFPYIARPVQQAATAGIPTVEINPGDSEVSGMVKYHLRQRAAEVLPELLKRL